MELVDFFSEMMKVNAMEDTEAKASASGELFKKLNYFNLPDHFNWVKEVFEGIHVKTER